LPYDILALASESYVAENAHPESDYGLSPVYADDELFKKLPDSSCFLSANFDPLLDDCSRFISRMRQVGKRPQWYLYDLPHGFLNFAAILPTAGAAIEQGSKYLKQFFQST
jgi:acetyl esterase/lipase